MKKEKKQPYIDDGHTVYDMSGVPGGFGKKSKTEQGEKLSRKEKRAAFKAALITYGPIFLGVLVCFGAAMGLIALWLR